MSELVFWPAAILTPQTQPFNLRPFTRSGGRSLGGISRNVRTDRGYWVGAYNGVVFRRGRFEQRRVWNALRVALSGSAGLVVVPVCSTTLQAGGGITDFAPILAPHDDGSSFDDDTFYAQGTIDLRMASFAPLGATIVTLRTVNATAVSGVRFSYQHALYETGRILAQPSAGTYQVEVFPAIRMAIPADALLEAERPTCLCHLATDSEMDFDPTVTGTGRPSVNFVEAVDYWNDLAIEVA